MKDCVSPNQPPVLSDQLALGAVQLLVHRLRWPPLLPCQKRRLVPVPTGSIRAKNPSPPLPVCHWTGPLGLPEKVTDMAPLSCAPPFAWGEAEVAKFPLMSPE